MTTGDKISKLRRENNYTQEQLAELLGVSRQAISKWESSLAYPETDKLIRLGELFDCSLDYLLKDSVEDRGVGKDTFDSRGVIKDTFDGSGSAYTYPEPTADDSLPDGGDSSDDITDFSVKIRGRRLRERKSAKTFLGLPLWHVAKNAKGIVAIGINATGIIAIGCKAKGLISIGVLSIGLLSCGTLALGLLTLGFISIGLIAAGCFALGAVATGAISFGIISVGGVAIGKFAVGGLAIGKYFAIGGAAKGMIAIGDSSATGALFERLVDRLGDLTSQDVDRIRLLLDENVPRWLNWAKDFIKLFLN